MPFLNSISACSSANLAKQCRHVQLEEKKGGEGGFFLAWLGLVWFEIQLEERNIAESYMLPGKPGVIFTEEFPMRDRKKAVASSLNGSTLWENSTDVPAQR